MKIFELGGEIKYLSIEYDRALSKLIEGSRGRRIGEKWVAASLQSRKGTVKKGIPLGDCPYFVPEILIISDRLKELISSFVSDQIEFLPVKIDGEAGYSCMNVLCVLDALDEERSELRRFDSSGRIMYVIQAKYREDIVDGHHIFLLSNYHGVYISEALKKHLDESGVYGVKYRDTTVRVENPFEEVFSSTKPPLH